eukprot:9210352-Ditylum_brightwellii.AAC.1
MATWKRVPLCVTQEHLSRKRADPVCDTINAAMLQGESCADAIVITSCYDQKLFYMISSVAKQIVRNRATRKVHSSQQKHMVKYQFL